MNQQSAHERRIVVGTDGTAHGEEAVRWAIGEARALGARVEVILVRPKDVLLPGTPFALQPHGRLPIQDGYPLAKEVARIHDELAADLAVETSVRTGDPASVLLAAAEGADLLVLGSPSEGRIGRLVFGSVAAACVRHAPCPIVLVTPEAAHHFSPKAS
ncbi:universal stress protein [Amycolatopsis keratiniphila]|uniref:Universal stress protein n=1 Tax=Amycolatopsis keratiniphila subsp. keratiniphila TaxID=227715 RepID=A0A1W2M1C1_9PSEU|nr:universal stress protein [Amycolatopsis keratiniphila]ONF73617.1 universal stress protein [Amycolatopsis keratiniphila subsp. keratiniphila]